MKFLQTGDIHVGESRYLDNYLDRHRAIFKQIIDLAVSKKLPLIVAGDLLHTKKTTYAEWWTAAQFLHDLDQAHVPTILIAGNHDHLFGTTHQTDLFKLFNLKHITIVGNDPQVVTIGDVDFICISWGDYEMEEMDTIVRRQFPKCKNTTRVVVCHETIVGSRTDNGTLLPKGVKLPHIPEVTYWAIGDIHSSQTANLPNSWYAGAPMQFHFGDAETRGLLLVDTDNPTTPEFIPLNSKKFKVVRSIEEMTSDCYFSLHSDVNTLIEVRDDRVIQKRRVDQQFDPIEVGTLEITTGLASFLAEKGIGPDDQSWAIDWVTEIAKKA